MRRARRPALAAALVFAFAALGAGLGWKVEQAPRSSPAGPPGPPPKRLPDIVLILVDTLRADRLGFYGYGRPTSPHLDAWARSGVVFRQARSQAGCTFPSVNSLFTGRYGQRFVGQPDGGLGIPPEFRTLAELLRERGYRTLAASASTIVRRRPSRHNPGAGFDAGFDEFDDDCEFGRAPCLNDAILRQVDAAPADRPVFLYLHYLEPHAAYEPARRHRRRFAQPAERFPRWLRRGDLNPVRDWLYRGGAAVAWSEEEARFAADLYDEEILGLDDGVAALLAALEARGRLRNAAVAFVADHGEELWEHGHIYHCRTVYDSSIRTPLVLSLPDGPAGAVLDEPVENLDVAPTLLDLAGVEEEDLARLGFEGRSLVPLIQGRSRGGSRFTFAQQDALRAVVDGRHKLVLDLASDTYRMFDLRDVPEESRDVLAERRREFHALAEALRRHIETVEGAGSRERSLERAAESRKALEALGYL